MTSHGTSRHGRYERLLRKHRLETREVRQELILDGGRVGNEQKTHARDLHDQRVELHEKRQYQPNPSTTEAQPDTQTIVTAGAEPITTTTTQVPEETASASEPTTVSIDSNQQTTELLTTTASDGASTTVTAVTTITTIVSYPSDPATESGIDLTTSIADQTAVAATAEGVSYERSTTEPAPSETSTVPTEPTESATELSTELASADTSTVPLSDSNDPAPSTSSEQDTVDTSTVPLTEPTKSVTAVASMSVALSEAVTEISGIIASLTSDIESLSTSTQQILPVSVSATSPATPSTVSASVPIISQSSGSSNNTPTLIGSNLDLPTAVVSTQSPSGTSAPSIIGVGSDDGSTFSSDINTDSTNSSITSDSTSSTTSAETTSQTYTSYSDSPSQSGYGWGDGNSSEPTGTSDGSTVSSDTGSSSISPQTTGKIVGGVVGGVAGASLLFLLLWFLLRRRRKTGFFLSSPASRSVADDGGVSGGLIGAPTRREMASRDSNNDSIFGAAYFAPAFMKRWRQSQISAGEESLVSTTPSSERGFQKISGRKLPSGAQPGFEDGNGSLSPTESEISTTLPPIIPRSAFSPSQPPPSNPFSMPLDTRYTREAPEEGVPVMRPSPARIPTSGSANAATWAEASARSVPMSFPMPPSGPIAIPKRPDALGRSHPSFDGSRGSRFTESL
ncbi:hypothetical protein BDW71DRAFT_76378 [Aspergillus fruticulosus]